MSGRLTGTPVIGPMLTRIGGLPVTTMAAVVPAVAHLLEELTAAEQRLTELAVPLSDALFALVPRLDDDTALRRRVLAAKRAVHRLRTLEWDDPTRQRFAARAGSAAAALVNDWNLTVADRDAVMQKLDEGACDHLKQAADSLIRLLDHDQFSRSLAVAAPDWLRHGHPIKSAQVKGRTLQTLFSYAARAALKTSPFSGLTTVGVPGRHGRGAAQSRASVTVGYLALLRLAHDPAFAKMLEYRVADIRPGGPDEPHGLMIHSEFTIANGTVWRADRVVEADQAARWAEAVPTDRRNRIDFRSLVGHLGGAQPWKRFRRLLDTGVIQPVPPWGNGGDPLQVLADLVRPVSADLAAELEVGCRAGEGLAGQGVPDRLHAVANLQRLSTTLGDATQTATRPSGMIYEDRETDLTLTDVGNIPGVHEDLEAAGRLIRPYIFRSHLYDVLLEQFVARFGSGGTCTDPLEFLMRLSVDRDANDLLDGAVIADFRTRAEPAERSHLPVGPTSAPPTAGVLFQLAAQHAGALAQGRYRLVLNHFSSGTGGLFGRFARLLGDDFRQDLISYVERCWPGVERRQLVYWTDCNTVQAECAGLLPPLLLPGEVPLAGGLTLNETLLTHDVATHTLTLQRRDGGVLGLGYLGLIPQHLLQSYVRLLAVLADPWVNASPHTDYTLTKYHQLAPYLGDHVSEVPRQEVGRVVVQRRSWIVPVADIPTPGAGQNAAELLRELENFRQAHGMPDEVFAHQLGGMAFPMGSDRKPMWISLRSPMSIGVFHNWLAQQTRHVRLVEALPARDEHFQLGHDGFPVGTEHAVLLAWDRPGGL